MFGIPSARAAWAACVGFCGGCLRVTFPPFFAGEYSGYGDGEEKGIEGQVGDVGFGGCLEFPDAGWLVHHFIFCQSKGK